MINYLSRSKMFMKSVMINATYNLKLITHVLWNGGYVLVSLIISDMNKQRRTMLVIMFVSNLV